MEKEHLFSVRYNIHGIVTEVKISAYNQREAYSKLYWSLAKQDYTFSEIKVEKIYRLW